MKDIIPILYYSPMVMNQIFAVLNNGIIDTETQSKKNTVGVKLSAVVETIIKSIKGEVDLSADHSKEKTIIKNHDDFTRAIDTISKVKKLKLQNFLSSLESTESIFLLNGEFEMQRKQSILNKETRIILQHNEDDLIIRGVTSIQNWISVSLLDQILFSGKVNAGAIVIPLSMTDNIIDVKLACLFKSKE